MEVLRLKEWFLAQKRDLPWREKGTPYAVWVSEVMLQQTQVSVVIPYFMRWMQLFPTIEALARAPIEEVIKAWEGLGYYARARNLHEGARYVVEKYSGILPSEELKLREIKGLGAYTVGAILSFAFKQKAAAVDGNVLRVLSRYHSIEEDICKSKTVNLIREKAEAFLPDKEPWIVTEALIELGATICTKVPKCQSCPLSSTCRAFAEGKESELPIKSAKQQASSLIRSVAVIACNNRILVGRGAEGKVMAGLFEFPYFELQSADATVAMHRKWVKKELKLAVEWEKQLPHVKHSFTRYRALLIPHMYVAKVPGKVEGFEWHMIEELKKLPFSSGHRRILENVFG